MPRPYRAALIAAFLFAPAVAFAQGGIVQSGPVSPGHIPAWGGNGSLLDPGSRGANLTGPLGLGTWPTTGRPASPFIGTFGLNTTLNVTEVFTAGGWVNGVTFLGGILTLGAPPNNILTVTPGAAPTNRITFTQSGTGGYSFDGIVNAPGVNLATGTLNWTDATAPRNFNAHNVWTGTSALSVQLSLNRILTVDSISYPAGAFGSSQFITSLDINQQFGGPASTGGHIALNVLAQQTAATGNFAAGGNFNVVGAFLGANVSFNEGGTSFVAGSHTGSLFGFNPAVTMNSGATFFSEAAASEFNLNIKTGASVFVKYGVAIVKEATDHVQGASGLDAAIALSDQLTAVPWFYGVLFGNEGGQWAFDGNSVLIGSRLNSAQATQMGAAKWDIDFLSNTTTKGLIQGPNFHVGNTGNVRVGFGALKPNPAGMVIVADGLQAATATVASAGTGYAGGITYDANGNIWQLTVNGSGGIIAATIVQAVQTTTATTPIDIPGINYSIAASGGSLNVSYASGTDIIMPDLPTSAPATHCALWSNSNVITRTTCP